MGILRDIFGAGASASKPTGFRGLLSNLFGGKQSAPAGSSRADRVISQTKGELTRGPTARAESRLDSILRGDRQAQVAQEISAEVDRATAEARKKGDEDARLDAILRGDRKAIREAEERKRVESTIEREEVKRVEPTAPEGGIKWIPAASSLVDAYRWEPAKVVDLGGGVTSTVQEPRLWIRFTTKSGKPGQEGYYSGVTEDEYDSLFSASSVGEYLWDICIGPKVPFVRTGTGPLTGRRLPWPRRGSRGGNLTPGSWWSRTGNLERAERR